MASVQAHLAAGGETSIGGVVFSVYGQPTGRTLKISVAKWRLIAVRYAKDKRAGRRGRGLPLARRTVAAKDRRGGGELVRRRTGWENSWVSEILIAGIEAIDTPETKNFPAFAPVQGRGLKLPPGWGKAHHVLFALAWG
jgi:hypothetical protein